MAQVMFCDEIYDVEETEDKMILTINKNKRGFKIRFEISGTEKEGEEVKEYLTNFLIKNFKKDC